MSLFENNMKDIQGTYLFPRKILKAKIIIVDIIKYCSMFAGYSDTNLPRVRVSATSN
jgi:hypothetical protein